MTQIGILRYKTPGASVRFQCHTPSITAFCHRHYFSDNTTFVAESSRTMSAREVKDQPGNKKHKKRDTHFLCFPLTTPTSIPQLADSLRHFRTATIPQGNRREFDVRNSTADSTVSHDQNEASDAKNSAKRAPLKIIPERAHRPPGTYHLTIGVMDLSEQSEMDRALGLLQSLDLQSMLASAHDLPQPPTRSRQRQPLSEGKESPEKDDTLSKAKVDSTEDVTSKIDSLSRPVSPPRSSKAAKDSNPTTSADHEISPITVSLSGLAAFNSPKKARVFYAKPYDPSQRLYNFGLSIRRRFREAGFITEMRPLVLHATVANMRYAVQAHGGRTSKGRKWARGKERWEEGIIDATEVVRIFDTCGGRLEDARLDRDSERQEESAKIEVENKDDEEQSNVSEAGVANSKEKEYLWAKDVVIDRVALCKMGAEKSDDEILGMVYPPVGEKKIFPD